MILTSTLMCTKMYMYKCTCYALKKRIESIIHPNAPNISKKRNARMT